MSRSVGSKGVHLFSKGLDIRLAGAPRQQIEDGPPVARVAILGDDYPGLRPSFAVDVGSRVARGALLFEDRATPGVRFTSPADGTVAAIHRGRRRAFRSIVVELSAAERSGRGATVSLAGYSARRLDQLSEQQICDLLLESGLWTALRTRPFNTVANPATRPDALFVTATDTAPLAANPSVVIQARADDFRSGLSALAKLPRGPAFLCVGETDDVEGAEQTGFAVERFGGPHPAGTAGAHIHRLFPFDDERQVWTIGYQEVIAVGALFRSGSIDSRRVVALSGPMVETPRLVRTQLGASIPDLLRGQTTSDECFVVSGSVLDGRAADPRETAFLGRYHNQVCALQAADPSTRGGPILALGRFERIFPFDLLPTFLLRALAAGDIETAQELGCLELVEEDLALCSYVCPAGNDYGTMLRSMLDRIRVERGEGER